MVSILGISEIQALQAQHVLCSPDLIFVRTFPGPHHVLWPLLRLAGPEPTSCAHGLASTSTLAQIYPHCTLWCNDRALRLSNLCLGHFKEGSGLWLVTTGALDLLKIFPSVQLSLGLDPGCASLTQQHL